jgi:hypothetical protein
MVCVWACGAAIMLGLASPALGSTGPFILSTRGGVEVWSEPQADPAAGFRATKVVLRTTSPTASVVTFENIAVTGAVHQVFDSIVMDPTPHPDTLADSAVFNSSWGVFDSHLLITPSMVGGAAGGGFSGISERHDGSLGSGGLPPSSGGSNAKTGIGDLAMASPTDAFFLDTPFQGSELEFAYLVTPVGGAGVFLTLGALGQGIVNSGDPGGARWGFGPDDGPLPVLFRNPVPEPAAGLLGAVAGLGLWAARRRHAGSRSAPAGLRVSPR